MQYKLGKLPARPEAVKLRLRDYITKDIWVPSGDFGHTSLVSDWQMLGNDKVGDCAIAQPYHGLMLWNKMADANVNVDTACTLAAYSAITGYNPNNPDSDRGSDMLQVADYWQNTGLKDADGKVHKIDAYVSLTPGDFKELCTAMYLFGGAGIGISVCSDWTAASRQGRPWDYVANPNFLGGHAVLASGLVSGMAQVITWGKVQLMTQAGYQEFNDESHAYLDKDMFANIAEKDIDGFDYQQLLADMKDLASEPELGQWADDGGYIP